MHDKTASQVPTEEKNTPEDKWEPPVSHSIHNTGSTKRCVFHRTFEYLCITE